METAVWQAMALFISVLAAGGVVLLYSKLKQYSFKPLFLFGGAFIFALTLVHILPEVFDSGLSAFEAGIWILLGFITQLFLENMTQGIDHGEVVSKEKLRLSPWSLLIGLCLHALLEGMYLGIPEQHDGHNHLFWGVMFHKIPAAVALTALMRSVWGSSGRVSLGVVLFSLAAPLGIFASRFLWINEWLSEGFFQSMTAFVGGGFLFISTSLFSALKHTGAHRAQKFAAVLLGIVLAVFMEVL
ncbi:MAG: ZIP family metal transporter [Cytophagales bacterium]|nr:ZIP family metal transporter [Cytophagales bacterium]